MNFLPVSMRLIKMLQKNIKKGAKKGICLQGKQFFEVIECKVGPHAIEDAQTPPDPEGSNGSDDPNVPWVAWPPAKGAKSSMACM